MQFRLANVPPSWSNLSLGPLEHASMRFGASYSRIAYHVLSYLCLLLLLRAGRMTMKAMPSLSELKLHLQVGLGHGNTRHDPMSSRLRLPRPSQPTLPHHPTPPVSASNHLLHALDMDCADCTLGRMGVPPERAARAPYGKSAWRSDIGGRRAARSPPRGRRSPPASTSVPLGS